MGTSNMSVISLLALGVLAVVSAAGWYLSEWEWWPFLLALSGMAFAVGLVLFLAKRAVR